METSKRLFELDQAELSKLIQNIKAKQAELGLEKVEFTIHKQLIKGSKDHSEAIFVFEGIVPAELKAKVNQLREEVDKIFEGYQGETYEFEVSFGMGVGQKFPTLEKLVSVPTKEEKTFVCQPGEVTLIDFWATWCGPCQKPMAHNQEMLEKNEEKWKGKARIVGVSVDNTVDVVEGRINERGWHKIENYQSPGGFKSPAAAQFGINGIPCVFLVDKKGIIRYRGHPMSCNLEVEINKLIAEEDGQSRTTETKKESSGESVISVSEESNFIQKFTEVADANKHLVEDIPGFCSGIIGSRQFREGTENFTGKLFFAGTFKSDKKAAVLQYINKLKETVPKDYTVDNRLGIVDMPEIHLGSSCGTCKKALGKGTPHYICTVCQIEKKEDYAFCTECADVELTKELKSGNDLFHPHGLLLIHEDGENSLKSLKRLMNKVMVIPDNHPQLPQVIQEKACGYVVCDGCRQNPILNCRWACANCADFDFCTECLKISRDAKHEKNAELVERTKKGGHDPSHVFYRSNFLMNIRPADPQPLEL